MQPIVKQRSPTFIVIAHPIQIRHQPVKMLLTFQGEHRSLGRLLGDVARARSGCVNWVHQERTAITSWPMILIAVAHSSNFAVNSQTSIIFLKPFLADLLLTGAASVADP